MMSITLNLRARISGPPRGLILMYHSVGEPTVDPWSLSVSPAHFAEQLEVLQRHMNPISLREFVSGYRTGTLPPRAVVLTFDDGYVNNLCSARPLLEAHGVPATVFIPTGYVEGDRLFWWDELASIFLETTSLPERLALSIAGETHEWMLGEGATYPADEQARDAGWNYKEKLPTVRHAILLDVWQRLYETDGRERQEALTKLRAWAGLVPGERSAQHPMNMEELQELSRSPVVTIGAHTITHAPLATLPVAEQRLEIEGGKTALEQIVDVSVDLFAYPHGSFDRRTIDILRDCGFAGACTVEPGPVRQRSNRFHLPRLQVHDWDGDEFERQLNHWLSDFS